jgi:hypothetical protein
MIKLIDILKEAISTIQYKKPNFENEWMEANRYPEFQKMGKEKWVELAQQGGPVKLGDILTNAGVSIDGIDGVLGNVDLDFDSLEEPKKERFIQALNSGTVEMPIAVKFGENNYDLVAGNTRLSGLIKNKINPSIWVVEL